jgi:predicted adenylyl cyclase CyaB
MKNIEVEVRGRLSNDEYNNLLGTLKKMGEYTGTRKRVLLDYSTFLPGEGVRERTRDIRLRVTNGVPEIITKIGKWGGKESRRELSIKTEKGSFDTLVQNYGMLGFTRAVLCVRNTEVFEYKDIEFALVEVPDHSYYFEAEKVVDDESKTDQAHKELADVCHELGLSVLDDEGFFSYIETLNKEANEAFDYDEYTEGYFAKQFNL